MNSSNSILSMCMCADVHSTKYSRVHTMILQVWFGDISLAKERETGFSIIQTSCLFPLGVTLEIKLLSVEDCRGIITQHLQKKSGLLHSPNNPATRNSVPGGFPLSLPGGLLMSLPAEKCLTFTFHLSV